MCHFKSELHTGILYLVRQHVLNKEPIDCDAQLTGQLNKQDSLQTQ